MTANRNSYYMGSLDGLRLLSFLVIFIHHMPAGAAVPLFAQRGKVAVELFFIISAYLLFRLLAAEDEKAGRISLRNFYLRRALRIYPLLIAYYGVTFIARHGFTDAMARIRFITTLFNVDNLAVWFWGYNFTIPAVGHLWTLAFEFQVYLLLPFAFLAWRKWGTPRFLLGLAVVEVLAFTARVWALKSGIPAEPVVYVIPYLRPESILLGLALAATKPTWRPQWSFLAAICAGWAYLALPADDGYFRYFPAAVLVASLVDAGLRWAPLRAVFTWAPVRNLGIISYGLYVFHIAAIWTVVRLLQVAGFNGPVYGPVVVLLSFALTVSAATLSYRLIERPFLKVKLRFTTVDGRAGAPEEHWTDASDVLAAHPPHIPHAPHKERADS